MATVSLLIQSKCKLDFPFNWKKKISLFYLDKNGLVLDSPPVSFFSFFLYLFLFADISVKPLRHRHTDDQQADRNEEIAESWQTNWTCYSANTDLLASDSVLNIVNVLSFFFDYKITVHSMEDYCYLKMFTNFKFEIILFYWQILLLNLDRNCRKKQKWSVNKSKNINLEIVQK